MLNLPLYSLFDTTRDRFNRHLGLADYMLLLDALQQGIGIGNKNDLRDVCAMLWLKNKPQQDAFKAYFEEWQQNEVNTFVKNKKESLATEFDQDKKNTELGKTNKETLPKPEIPSLDSSAKAETQLEADNQTPTKDSKEMVTVQWNMGKVASEDGNAWDTEGGLTERRQLTGKYIMTDNYHPFSERQLTQEWRRLQRKQVVGESREMDIKATIKHVAQQGFFDKPVMQRRLVNDYRLIVLVDWKGSMLAFHTLSDLIVETLKETLPKTEVWYFRNQPQEYFYGRPDWTQAIETKDWLFQLKQNPANILIISDGGAARGNFVTERLQSWWRFFKEVKPIVPNIVWLNPMPKERWVGTTAGYVDKLVRMKGIDDIKEDDEIKMNENSKVIKEIFRLIKT